MCGKYISVHRLAGLASAARENKDARPRSKREFICLFKGYTHTPDNQGTPLRCYLRSTHHPDSLCKQPIFSPFHHQSLLANTQQHNFLYSNHVSSKRTATRALDTATTFDNNRKWRFRSRNLSSGFLRPIRDCTGRK